MVPCFILWNLVQFGRGLRHGTFFLTDSEGGNMNTMLEISFGVTYQRQMEKVMPFPDGAGEH